MWLDPPQRKKRITDFACPPEALDAFEAACAILGDPQGSPASMQPEATRKLRRSR